MTFSATKLRINSTQTLDAGGGGGLLPAQIPCGTIVDSVVDLDIVLIQDTTGSYGASAIPFIRQLAPCIITAFPRARLGLAYFADYGDAYPYGEQYKLGNYTAANTASWILPSQGGGDEYEASLDAFYYAATSGTIGWRDCAKKVIILNTDTYPHDRAIEGGSTYVTRAMAAAACRDRNIWPIYVLTSSYYYSAWLNAGRPAQQYTSYPYNNSAYSLGYGGYGFGTPGDLPTLDSQIISAILYGIYQTIPATCAGDTWWSSIPERQLYFSNPGNFSASWGDFIKTDGVWVGTPVDANVLPNVVTSFTKTFRVPTTGNYNFRYSVDNEFEFYVDGTFVISSTDTYNSYGYYNNYNLTAGEHTLIFNLENFGNGANTWIDNPGALAFKIFDANNNLILNLSDSIDANLFLSVDSYNIQSYPNTGSVWYDTTINHRNGGLYNATFNPVDKTFNFTAASSSRISFGDLGPLPNTGSFSMWFNSSDWVSYRNVFATHFNGGNIGFRLEQYNDGSLNVGVGNDSGTNVGYNVIPAGSSRNGQWFNVVITWDKINNRLKAYYNGIKTVDQSHSLWPTNLTGVTLGVGYNTARYFSGKFSTFVINKNILTDSEVASKYYQLRGRYIPQYQDLSLYLDAGVSASYSGSGTSWYDLSGNDNTATLINGPSYSSANSGSIVFDGTNDYTSVPDFNLGDNYAFTAWIKTTTTDTGVIVARGKSDNSRGVYMSINNNNDGYLYAGGNDGTGSNSQKVSNLKINDGAWHLVTCVYNQTTDTVTGYVDGVEGITASLYADNNNYTPKNTVIGKNAISNTQFFNGNIAQVSIYNRSLTSTEIKQRYISDRTRYDISGLVLYLDATDTYSYSGTGTTWKDLSGYDRNATILGSPTFADVGFTTTSDSTYFTVPTTGLSPRTGDFTYSIWLRWSSIFDYQGLFEMGSWTDSLLFRYQTGYLYVYAEGSDLGGVSFLPTVGVWYNVVLQRKDGVASIYVNNMLRGTLNMTTDINISDGTMNIMRSRHAGGQYLPGRISTFLMFNRALSAVEIENYYNITRRRYDTSGPVLELDAGDVLSYSGSGTTWYDLSGTNNHVTLINGPTYNSASNGSIVFDGTNDYASSVSIPNPNGQLSVTVTMNYNAANAYQNIFDNGSDRPMLWIDANNKLEVSYASGAGGVTSNSAYNGQDIIVTAIYNSVSSPGIQLYVNGILIGSNSSPHVSWSNPSTFTLFNRAGSQTFNGKIYSIKFYNRALAPYEVAADYVKSKAKFSSVYRGLIGYLDANSSYNSYNVSASTWYDISGYNNNGTAINSPVANSVYGGVVEFNGTNQVVRWQGSDLRFRPSTVITGSRYLWGGSRGRVVAGLYNNWLLGHHGDLIDRFYAEGWVYTGQNSDSRWRVYTGVSDYNNDRYRIYSDDRLLANNTSGSQGPNGLGLGYYAPGGSEYSKSQISFVLVYNRILSDAEIANVYSEFSGRFAQDKGLVLHLDANNVNSYNGTGTTAYDLSGFNNHATMTSATFNTANGGTFLFSNKTSYIRTSYDTDRYPTGAAPRTLVAIISPQAGYQDLSAFGIGGNGYAGARTNIFLRDNKIMLEHYNGGRIPANNYSQNAWYHVALVSSGYINAYDDKLYINGILQQPLSNVYGDSFINTQVVDAVLGQIPGAVPNSGLGYVGKIPVAKMWNRALSNTEIELDYNSYTGRYEFGTKQGLVFNLDAANTSSYSGTGNTWYDLSGYNATANLGSFPQYNTSKGNGHISFYGSQGQTAQFTVAPVLDASTITVEMLVRVNALNDAMLFGWSEYDVYTLGGVLSFNTSNGDRYGVPAANVAAANVAGNWKHLAFVMRHDNSYTSNRIYIDGVEQTLSQIAGSQNTSKRNFNNGYGAISGWRINTSYRNHQDVGVFRVYNGELSNTQINQNYNELKTRYNNTSLVLDLDANNTNSYNASVAANVWFDMSSENNHAIFINAPSTGPYESANNGYIRFRSANSVWANIANSNTSGFGFGATSFTMSAWATANSMASTYAWIHSYGNPATSQARFIGRINNTHWFGGYGDDLAAGPAIVPNTWYNIVGVYDGSQATMYINGQKMVGPTTKGWNTNKLVARIGRQVNETTNEYWDGNVSKIQLYNRALSNTEIQANFDAVKERYFVDTTNLVLDLDAANTSSYPGSGTTWTDLSGKGNHGTLVNGPTFSSANGGSIVFDGTNDYISFPTTGFYYVPYNGTLPEFTINAWVYWTAFPSTALDEIVSWWATGTQIYADGFLGTDTRGTVGGTNTNPMIRFGDDWQATGVSFTAATDINKWWNITAVKTADNAYVYRNGVLVATKGSALSWGFNGNLVIGRQGATPAVPGEYIKGRIAKVQLYSKALSGTEISTNFDNLKSTYGL